jgi:hypothetical protein
VCSQLTGIESTRTTTMTAGGVDLTEQETEDEVMEAFSIE